MFIKNCWYVAAEVAELSREAPIARKIINEPLVLYKDSDGRPVVFEDRCLHRWAALSAGRIEGNDLRCMYHGIKFDAQGRCIEVPGQANPLKGAALRRYPAVPKHGWVWVWMGALDKADERLIPTNAMAEGIDAGVYEGFSGQLPYDANYELINDNLTDFAHLSYVHPNSFGASEEWAHTRPRVTQLERGVHIDRWILEDTITPKAIPSLAGRPLRNWTSLDYLAPGVLLLETGSFAPEDMPADGSAPTVKALSASFNWQAVTPVTETTSRYYFAWGVPRYENRPELVDVMRHVIHAAFAEDKAMIERQQQVWNDTRNTRMWGSSSDLALNKMRQTVQRLIAEETAEPQTA